ncbi:MAG: hypothetical protein MHM6MM_009098, partial [Cercozoa sp. M6MM]
TVQRIEYDTTRTARLALVRYEDGDVRYTVAWEGCKIGDSLFATKRSTPPHDGVRMPLCRMPEGSTIHLLEMSPDKGAALCRAAGSSARILASQHSSMVPEHLPGHVLVQLASGEKRWFFGQCMASIGSAGNSLHANEQWGKAGRRRNLGWRPAVAGVNMNPVDHPHGGGEGHKDGGYHAKSYSGVLVGKRTGKYRKSWRDKRLYSRRPRNEKRYGHLENFNPEFKEKERIRELRDREAKKRVASGPGAAMRKAARASRSS